MFFLLQTDPGWADAAGAFLRGRDGVAQVAATTGPFDLIVTAEVDSTVALERLVGVCRRAPGLVRLSRCHARQRPPLAPP